jgi:hypothetical protein
MQPVPAALRAAPCLCLGILRRNRSSSLRRYVGGIFTALLVFSATAAVASAKAAPKVSITPSTLKFPTSGQIGVGFSTAAQTVTLKNTGSATLTIGNTCGGATPCSEGSYSGDFSIASNSCDDGATIPANSSCSFTVSFRPSTTNDETGTIAIADSASNSPQTVAVQGQGTAPTASVTPASLQFPSSGSGPLGIDFSSQAQTVTVKNTGTVPMLIGDTCAGVSPCSEGSYSGDFSVRSNSCGYGNTIPANTTCTFTVTFTPSTANDETGAIVIADTASGGSQSVSVAGQGTAPTATLSPTSLSFFSSSVGSPSALQTVTLDNTGDVPMLIGDTCAGVSPCSEGSYSRDFSIGSNSCENGDTIPANTTCSFTVGFTPSTSNDETGTIVVNDTASGGAQTINVAGLATSATVKVSTTALSFKSSGIGATSAAQQVTVTNTGKVSVQMGYGSPSPERAVSP